MISELRPGRLLRRGARLLWAVMHNRRSTLARPKDAPSVLADGSGEPLRILLMGNGLVHGWGVRSHAMAPSGELARGVRTLTGRPCEVEFVGDAVMDAESAPAWLEGRAHRSRSAAVVSLGTTESLCMTSVAEWGSRLIDLLDALQGALPEGAPVLLVGVPDVYVPGAVRALPPVVSVHARRLDAVVRRIADVRPGTAYLEPPPLTRFAGDAPGPDLYAAFATALAVGVADAVLHSDVVPAEQGPARTTPPEVAAALAAARWEELPQLADLVRRAKERFGVDDSAVTLLDGDRAHYIAHNGATPEAVPARLSYCQTVVATDEPLIVSDSRKDPRFAANPFVDLVHASFYTGVPLHGADGSPIGAMCLTHGFPKPPGAVDLDELQAFAHEAEAILRSVAEDQRVATD